MDTATRYAEGLARADLKRPSVNRPGRDPLKSIDRLLEGVVAVWCRHLAVGRNEALEDARAPVRVDGLNQEAHTECTHLDHFGRCWTHSVSSPILSRASASIASYVTSNASAPPATA